MRRPCPSHCSWQRNMFIGIMNNTNSKENHPVGVSSRGIYQFMPSVGVYSIGVWEVLICVCIFLKGVYIAVEGRRRRADQRLQPSGGLFSLFTVREVQNVSRRYFAECAERRERESPTDGFVGYHHTLFL